MRFTPWWSRVMSFLVDYFLVSIPFGVAGLVDPRGTALEVGLGVVTFALLVYNRWYLGGRGQSWGKKLLDTHLHKEAGGRPIGTWMSFVRDVCHLLDALPCFLGFLRPLWDGRRQTFADKIVKTVVTPAETPLPEPLAPNWRAPGRPEGAA
ncbi:RDD family protein [Kitasatospora herbaricolor]|uniref:RDD family protein n=1 Tax=Kitasatospora herbaricolor TaxID=68217 RepID=A0ABZ1WH28_9ACTN|nr:RDD family protein [Kitasatospora herbaricolor]